MVKINLCGLTSDEIFEHIRPSGFTFEHAKQISKNIYKRSITLVSDFTGLPKKLTTFLDAEAETGIWLPVSAKVSDDTSIKYLYRTADGIEFETVYMTDGKRKTVCVSTQAGCRMGCVFCVTGRYGFRRNLTTGEIVNQVISLKRSKDITHVVFMGMGEPMDNLENVLNACKILTAEWGLAISPRNITVSTVGITMPVWKFLECSDCNLTVSLYSPFREERKRAVPAENSYPIYDIIEMLKIFPLKKKRRLSLAYVMIRDINDSVLHLDALRSLLTGSRIRVNLLPYHSRPGDVNISSSAERMQFYKHNLIISGISASVRRSRGEDIYAACGLLASGLKK